MDKLSQELKETSALALWDGNKAVIYQSNSPDQALKATINEGTINGLHFTCIGKAILAELPESELLKIFSAGLERSTYKTITDTIELKRQLRVIHKEGVAYDDEEYSTGIRGAASVLKNDERKVAGAICILGPSVRLNRSRLKECGDLVRQYAQNISCELGYISP